jgi:GMP reductase
MIRIDHEVKLDYSDVMLVPQPRHDGPNSRTDVNLLVGVHDLVRFSFTAVPIIAANMDGVGTFEMALELAKHKVMTALVKHYTATELATFFLNNWDMADFFIYSMGANATDLLKWTNFVTMMGDKDLPAVCVDVANGYTQSTSQFIKNLRSVFPRLKIIAGNVVTPDGVEQLAAAGADIVKIGIGPGSVCTTRKMTGIGYPQFSAVLECAKAAHACKTQIIADGGCQNPGDVAKALAAGADYVMLGGMLAGHDEGGGQTVNEDSNITQGITHGKPLFKRFYGMASKTAQAAHAGSADYRASEGKEVLVPYRGPVKNTINDILGGLRSSLTLLGIREISDISDDVQFIRVNNQLNNVFGK